MKKKLFKRGMSPIIATILLIAFAVSIGATIISQGGIIYSKKFISEDGDCSNVLINIFGLEERKECENYEFKSIIKFYLLNETIITPQCYSVIGTGKGDMCITPELLLESNWAPTKSSIK